MPLLEAALCSPTALSPCSQQRHAEAECVSGRESSIDWLIRYFCLPSSWDAKCSLPKRLPLVANYPKMIKNVEREKLSCCFWSLEYWKQNYTLWVYFDKWICSENEHKKGTVGWHVYFFLSGLCITQVQGKFYNCLTHECSLVISQRGTQLLLLSCCIMTIDNNLGHHFPLHVSRWLLWQLWYFISGFAQVLLIRTW